MFFKRKSNPVEYQPYKSVIVSEDQSTGVVTEVKVSTSAHMDSMQRKIQEIHNAFDSAADIALEEAKMLLAVNAINPQDEAKAQKLKSIGFTSVPVVKKLEQTRSQNATHRIKMEVIMRYQQKYPQYKFITLDQVKAICKTYGLVFGSVDRYIGDIPEKNIDEIANFKVGKEDTYYLSIPQEMTLRGFSVEAAVANEWSSFITAEQTDKLKKKIKEVSENHWRHFSSNATFEQAVPLFICAPRKDMKMDSNTKEKNGMLYQEIPDPIVLHFVKDGFLIVSKWGLEGEDPMLVNEKAN